jgi:hypothetical protein
MVDTKCKPMVYSFPMSTEFNFEQIMADIFAKAKPSEIAASLPEPISRQAVYKWRRVPHEHVLSVEAITGISRHRIRPDIYPIDDGYMSITAS